MEGSPPSPETQRLHALYSYGILDSSPDERIDRITRLASRICNVPVALVTLVDEHRQWFLSRVGVDVDETPRSISFCSHAIGGSDILEVQDALLDARFKENPLVTGEPCIRFYAGAPLTMSDGHRFGTLCVIGFEPRSLTGEQREVLQDLASLVVVELERHNRAARLVAETEYERRVTARFRALVQSSSDLIVLLDAQAGITYASPSSTRILGYIPEDLLGRNARDLIHPESIACFQKTFDALVSTATSTLEEFRFRTSAGEWRWLEATATSLLHDPDVTGIVINARDITEKKEKEQALALQGAALRRSEQRLRSLVSAMTQEVWIASETGVVARLGEAEDDHAGPARAPLNQGGRTDTLHPNDRPRIEAAWQRHLASKTLYEDQYRVRCPDGSYHWFAVRAVPVFDTDGRFIEWVGTCTDIDDPKRAAAALHESEERLRAALDAAEVGTWRVDLRTGQSTRDSAMNRLLGLPPEQGTFGLPDYYEHVHADDRPAARAAFEKAIETGVYFSEHRIVLPDGEMRWLRDRGRVIYDTEHRPRYVTGAIADITDRKLAEVEIVLAREKAEEMARLKDVFLANMSHEIRTPLTSILGYSEILAEEITGDGKEFVDVIRTNGERLLETLNSVLDLAQLESGSLRIKSVSFDVMSELESVLTQFEAVAENKGLQLKVVSGSDNVTLLADRTAFGRVVTNLVSNAVKFTDEGGVTLFVQDEGDRVVLRVADTGVGIGEDFLEHLFEEFQQESSGISRNYEGSGLGLAITKRLLDLMGGEIAVESERGRGTTFTVSFGRHAVKPESARQIEDLQSPPKPRVLAVEDNEQTRKLLHHVLSPRYNLNSASGYGDAFELAGSHEFAAFLIDIDLGADKSGIDLLHALRRIPRYETAPCIACTAYALPGDKERFLNEGFDAYVGKPFRRATLLQVLENVLSKQREHAQR